MTAQHLKIGRISYSNLFPVFHTLEKEFGCSSYEFVEGVPSALNRLLREGRLDVSPSSSIEYLRHKDEYTLLEGHSISSSGPIGSILLFSKRPIEELNGSTVLVSSQSETSAVLLEIILRKFYKLECTFRPGDKPLSKALESHPAYLLIGDEALIAKDATKNSEILTPSSKLYIYDLGEIWQKHTGLPFVFALWIARKDFCAQNPLLVKQFKKNLDTAKLMAMKNLKTLAGVSPLKGIFSEAEIMTYWKGISYDLKDEHKKGLELFRKYVEALKL